MKRYIWGSSISITLLALLGSVAAVGSWIISAPAQVSAQETTQTPQAQTPNPQNFPDVKPDYWASPFIRTLNQQGILAGYLDGTFRPEEPVERDEFAAMIRQAFNQEQVRTIPSGSVFNDVPANYWAAPPIEQAYEQGFMKGFEENRFRPQEPMSRVQALMALSRGLNLGYTPPTATSTQAMTTPVAVAPPGQRQAKKQRTRFLFPLAGTMLMQSIVRPVVAAQPQAAPASPDPAAVATGQAATSALSASEYVNSFYRDADQIPEYAINDVAATTQSNLVVNYPEVGLLNPNQPLNRGAAAALIYQAMVRQGKLQPISTDIEAFNYIVNPTSPNNQTAQTAQ